MEFGEKARRLLRIDHKAQIEIVRRLAHQMNAFFFEYFEGRAEFWQNRAYLSTDKADSRTIADYAHLAEGLKIGNERSFDGWLKHFVRRIYRYRNVGLRGRDQIDRYSVAAEALERAGQKSNLLPHANALHRNQRQAVANADSFYLWLDFAGHCRHLSSAQPGLGCTANEQRNPVALQRRYTTRMQDCAPRRCQFLCLVVMQFREQPRRGNMPWVSGKHARDVCPYFEASRLQFRRKISGGCIRTAPTQKYGFTVRSARDKALGHNHLAAVREPVTQFRVWFIITGRCKIRTVVGLPSRATTQ